MRLLHPLHNLRRHSTTAFEGLEETRFAVCRASPFNDHDASASTTGHDLFGSPALLTERRDDRPSLCPSPSVRPVGSGRPRQNWFSRLRPRQTASEHPPDHPAGSNPRLTGTAPTATFAHTKTALVMGTVALLALMAMGCGSSDAPSSPDADQPAVVTQVQQDQNDNQTQTSETGASSATDTTAQDGDQQAGDSTQSSASEEPTNTPRPTPDNRPDATPTPQPTPTPTVVPTPTPDPMGPAFNLMRGYWEDPNKQDFLDLRQYNEHLIRNELSESLIDPVGEQHPDLLAAYRKKDLITLISKGLEIAALERVPSDGDQLHVKINFNLYLSTGPEDFTHSGSATGTVDLVSPPYQNTNIPQGRQLEAITEQVPVFSHVTGTPTLGPAQ